MKSKILLFDTYSFSGSNVLSQMQDNTTPNIDLLVRESVQNSCDAFDEKKDFIRMNFIVDQFENQKFKNLFSNVDQFNIPFNQSKYDFLAICDSNTTGLLGVHYKSSEEDQNLFKLVYDVMNKKEGLISGGSWGIGKSVYYRFGVGFCVFYSRTFENDRYINKLAIIFIEDETKSNRIINVKNNRGIALFGDIDDEDRAMPIYDDFQIKEILDIFNIKMYDGTETGTVVIIPYLNKNSFDYRINEERCFWNNDFEKNLNISLQRWYFPRLNNAKYDGRYLLAAINGEKVELNKFFSIMQSMYNGNLDSCEERTIFSKSPAINLGKLYLKKFTTNDLLMDPPYNYPSPYCFFDLSEEDFVSKPIICYARKPGMIVTYDKNDWNSVPLNEKEFILGIFKLNDDVEYNSEKLGQYVRGTEKSNHKEWKDSSVEECPTLTEKRPIRRIFNHIKLILTELYDSNKNQEVESSNSKLRKKLGKLLLPPSGFGRGTSIEPKGKSGGGLKVSKKNKTNVTFNGFEDGLLCFEASAFLEKSDEIFMNFYINSNKKYSFSEWMSMGFELPCSVSSIKVSNIRIGKEEIKSSRVFVFDENLKSGILRDSIKFVFKKNNLGVFYGIIIKNVSKEEKPININFKIFIKPIDLTYSLNIETGLIPSKDGDK